jgi:hypothetical protein
MTDERSDLPMKINGDPATGMTWSPRVPDTGSPLFRRCDLEAHEREAIDLANFVIDWLDLEFARRDLGPGEIVMAFCRALSALRQIEKDAGYPEVRPAREALESIVKPYQEPARKLFNKTMKEVVHRILDGRLDYSEGSRGFELLHLCESAIGSDAICAAIESVADEIQAENNLDIGALDFGSIK